jgi:hypothetical protein
MSTEPERGVDTGHIRQLEEGSGWLAIFAVPYQPYYRAYPVVKWGVVKRDGVERVEAFVTNFGKRELQLLSLITEGEFIDTVSIELYTSQIFTDGQGNTAYDRVLKLASDVGRDMERQRQSPLPEFAESF